MSGAGSPSSGASSAGEIHEDPGGSAPLGGEGALVLLVRDPSSLYAHWALPEAPAPTNDRSWALRLYDLTTLNPAAAVEYACPSGLRAGQLTDLSPERRYRAELGAYDHAERWQPRLRSNAVQTPPATPTAWVDDRFVTIPWEVDLSGYAPPLLALPVTPAAGPAASRGCAARGPAGAQAPAGHGRVR
jgi:hypothetical protein